MKKLNREEIEVHGNLGMDYDYPHFTLMEKVNELIDEHDELKKRYLTLKLNEVKGSKNI